MRNQPIYIDFPSYIPTSEIEAFLRRLPLLGFAIVGVTAAHNQYLITSDNQYNLVKIGEFIGQKQRLPPQDDFNLIEDLRDFLRQSPHDHTVACLHYLGDDAQAWWAERERTLNNQQG